MKNMRAMGAAQASKQAGFTIIELVVVILLLGILTATALPRFLDISTEAHDAVVDGVEGGFATGLALARAEWFATGQPDALTADFASLNTATSGYPVGSSGGTASNDVDEGSECEEIMEGVLQASGVVNVISGNWTGYTDTGVDVPSDAELQEARDAVAGADILAALTAASTCTYYYIADTQRETVATVPNLVYTPANGNVVRSN